MIKTYYLLTKPGIVIGNLITTASAFALASRGNIDYGLFLATLIGLSLIIASACVFNNYIDREMDEKMERTRNRALVKKTIPVSNALLFAGVMVVSGTVILALYTNPLTVAVALTGFIVYVLLYSLLKYHSTYGTLVGSIAGAIPPVVGYCAVSNRLDMAALILFAILVLWQMPHFFAIVMYRLEDYVAAAVPVLPVVKGGYTTKVYMVLYVIAFIIATLLLTVFGYTGYTYLVAAALLGGTWLWLCVQGFKSTNDHLWARQIFLFSLVNITLLCLVMSFDTV